MSVLLFICLSLRSSPRPRVRHIWKRPIKKDNANSKRPLGYTVDWETASEEYELARRKRETSKGMPQLSTLSESFIKNLGDPGEEERILSDELI